MSERVLTKEQAEERRRACAVDCEWAATELHDSHEALRAALTQSAEKVARLELELADRCNIHCDVSCRELAINQERRSRDAIARLERTVEQMQEALNAARRILTHGSYDHAYCNQHDGERGAERKCPGCRAAAKDLALVFKETGTVGQW